MIRLHHNRSSNRKSRISHEGEHASPTRVVVRGLSVDGRSSVGLDEPLRPRPGLSGPAAERREVEVAGKPHVGCNKEKEAVSQLLNTRAEVCGSKP